MRVKYLFHSSILRTVKPNVRSKKCDGTFYNPPEYINVIYLLQQNVGGYFTARELYTPRKKFNISLQGIQVYSESFKFRDMKLDIA